MRDARAQDPGGLSLAVGADQLQGLATICGQMLPSVRVARVGDTDFLVKPVLSEAEGSRSIASASWRRTRRRLKPRSVGRPERRPSHSAAGSKMRA